MLSQVQQHKAWQCCPAATRTDQSPGSLSPGLILIGSPFQSSAMLAWDVHMLLPGAGGSACSSSSLAPCGHIIHLIVTMRLAAQSAAPHFDGWWDVCWNLTIRQPPVQCESACQVTVG